MRRPVSIPLWFCIVVIVLLCYIAFVVPFIGELNRGTAVGTLTVEHDKLGHFMVDAFKELIQSGRQDRQQEHADMKNDTKLIPEIYQMLKNRNGIN